MPVQLLSTRLHHQSGAGCDLGWVLDCTAAPACAAALCPSLLAEPSWLGLAEGKARLDVVLVAVVAGDAGAVRLGRETGEPAGVTTGDDAGLRDAPLGLSGRAKRASMGSARRGARCSSRTACEEAVRLLDSAVLAVEVEWLLVTMWEISLLSSGYRHWRGKCRGGPSAVIE